MIVDLAKQEPRWPSYGLRSDPFFSGALLPDEAGTRPIHLFRGRDKERETLEQRIKDAGSTASVIVAEGGHGKTSLASRVAHDLRNQYLVLPDELAFDHANPTASFYFDILDGIVRALLERGDVLPIPPKEPKNDPKHPQAAIVQTIRLVALYRSASGLQVGIHLGPFLAQSGGGQLVQPRYHPRHSRQLLADVVREIKETCGVLGVIVRVNNLDEPFLTNRSAKVVEFLNEARDLLQENGLHYLFCGNRDLENTISSINRVATVFGPPIRLQELDLADIRSILQARYDHLSTGRYTRPVDDALVERLHELHRGDLRNILKDFRSALEVARPLAGEPVLLDAAIPLLEELHLAALSGLKDHDWQVLEALAKGPKRPKDLAAALDRSPGRMSQITSALRVMGAIEEAEGADAGRYLALSGASRMALEARSRQT